MIDSEGALHGSDKRPRAIQNSIETGLVQMIQPVIFDFVKRIFPGFIQGMKKKEMKEVISGSIGSFWGSELERKKEVLTK